MCHFSEKTLDSNYVRIGLLIFVRFSWEKWLDTRLKIIEIIHTQNIKKIIKMTPAIESMTKNATTVFVVHWSKMATHFLNGVGSSNIENCTLFHIKKVAIFPSPFRS